MGSRLLTVLGSKRRRCAYDAIPNIVHAYEPARRVLTSYTGPLLRLRRDSDEAESDFGYVTKTGDLDTAAIAAWLGAANGYVVTVYDQKGSSNLTQATADSQPLYTDNGQASHGVPLFDGTNDSLTMLAPAGFLANNAKTIIAAFRDTASVGSYGFAVATRVNYAGVDNSARGYLMRTSTAFAYAHTNGGIVEAVGVHAPGEPYIVAAQVGANGASARLYLNGEDVTPAESTLVAAADELPNGHLVVGQQHTSYAGGQLCSLVLASGTMTSDQRTATERAMNAYWGVY